MALSLGGPVAVHRGSNPRILGIQFRWLLDSEVFGWFMVGRQARVYLHVTCIPKPGIEVGKVVEFSCYTTPNHARSLDLA